MPLKKNKTPPGAEPGRQEFFIPWEFAAPRALIFQACVDPELDGQALGPRGWDVK